MIKKRERAGGKRRKWKRELRGVLFLLPDFLGVICFALLPFGQVVIRSFRSAVGGSWVGVKNYRDVLKNTAFRLAVGNTLRFTLVCIPLLVTLSLALAVLIQSMPFGMTREVVPKSASRRIRPFGPGRVRFGNTRCVSESMKIGKGLLKSMFLVPVAVPAASVVLVWKVLFHSNGLLNGLLLGLGRERIAWMTSNAAFGVLVISYLWKNIGYDMILWLAGLSGISPDIYEAAQVDGAGKWKCFTKITLPNLKSSLYTISVLSFLNSFKVFREAWLMAGDYPHQSMYLLQHLYNNWFRELSFDKISAAAVCNALVVLGPILLLKRVWDREEV